MLFFTVRRKSSFARLDSSECASVPDSIYEAQRMSNTDSEAQPTPVEDIEFLYGQGTVLDTISEKKSNGTLTTVARTLSLNDLSKIAQ